MFVGEGIPKRVWKVKGHFGDFTSETTQRVQRDLLDQVCLQNLVFRLGMGAQKMHSSAVQGTRTSSAVILLSATLCLFVQTD